MSIHRCVACLSVHERVSEYVLDCMRVSGAHSQTSDHTLKRLCAVAVLQFGANSVRLRVTQRLSEFCSML